MEKTKSLKWFLDRIGKRIWRDRGTCTCPVCEEVYKNGIIIRDEFHAKYLHMIEQDFAIEGVFLNYRDSQIYYHLAEEIENERQLQKEQDQEDSDNGVYETETEL